MSTSIKGYLVLKYATKDKTSKEFDVYSLGVVSLEISCVLGSYFYVTGISYNKTQFTCLLSVIIFHMISITCLLSTFKKDRYEANQNNQS